VNAIHHEAEAPSLEASGSLDDKDRGVKRHGAGEGLAIVSHAAPSNLERH